MSTLAVLLTIEFLYILLAIILGITEFFAASPFVKLTDKLRSALGVFVVSLFIANCFTLVVMGIIWVFVWIATTF